MSLTHTFATTANDILTALPLEFLAGNNNNIEDCNSTTGFTGVACNEGNQIMNVLRALIAVVAVIFVIYKAVQSKFALGTIVVSALVAGLLVWIVYNVETLFQWFGGEVSNTAPESSVVEMVAVDDEPLAGPIVL